ncbi:MAG: flavin reductase family protein [Solirubrobacteraceae bacterium]
MTARAGNEPAAGSGAVAGGKPATGSEAARFRAVFGHFPTGVSVVTGLGARGPGAMTANAVCSLSLDPLLILVCFDNGARTLPLVRETKRFGVNVLRADQHHLSRLFASKRPERQKFTGVPWTERDGIPVLDGALAWLACDLTRLVPGGDHTIGIGAVTAMEHSDGEPLVFYRGEYRSLHDAAASDPPRPVRTPPSAPGRP